MAAIPNKVKLIISQFLQELENNNIAIEQAILFGSYAYGTPHDDSDIDLLVVTGDDYMPANYKEKSNIYLKAAMLIRDIEKKVPIDLIVHTKKMYERFTELNSMFYRKIEKEGIVLYDNSSR